MTRTHERLCRFCTVMLTMGAWMAAERAAASSPEQPHSAWLKPIPTVTRTESGHPADPVNVVLIGERKALLAAFHRIGWKPADPMTLISMATFIEGVALHHSDPTAPFSKNYLFGRVQDLAFEQEVNGSPRERHHIRIWAADINHHGRPIWLGAATYDRGIYLRKLAHHIGADVDAERDALFEALLHAKQISLPCWMPGIGATARGVSGEGDRYHTDGRSHLAWLNAAPPQNRQFMEARSPQHCKPEAF